MSMNLVSDATSVPSAAVSQSDAAAANGDASAGVSADDATVVRRQPAGSVATVHQ